MTLYTCYLGWFNRKDCLFQKDGDVFVNCGSKDLPKYLTPIYVMRNRGNDEIAPSKHLLAQAMSGEIDWAEYSHRYLAWIGHRNAVLWMKKTGELAKKNDVVLICYEKDFLHCHRHLLALNVVKWSGCEYGGEISLTEEA